eukprot:4393792-Alexandrium_andersonii.AAC.1
MADRDPAASEHLVRVCTPESLSCASTHRGHIVSTRCNCARAHLAIHTGCLLYTSDAADDM